MMLKQPWRAPAQDFLKAALAILGLHQELIFLTCSVQEGTKLSTTDGSKKKNFSLTFALDLKLFGFRGRGHVNLKLNLDPQVRIFSFIV